MEFIINHSESSILFVAKDKLSTVIQTLPNAHKGLKTLVYWGTHDERHPEMDEVCAECLLQWLLPTLCCRFKYCKGFDPSACIVVHLCRPRAT